MSSQKYIPADILPSTDLSCASSFLVYDWFRGQFPAWEPDFNPKQIACSQSLMAATIPESARGPKGMVHFKSILDPPWSAGDMASLRAGFPWVLLVLSPFERFYELDPVLDELSSGTSQLVIWRPDRPTVEESARLRVCSLVSTTRTGEPGATKGSPVHASNDIRQLLTELYVQRGILIVQGVRHPIAKEMGNLSLPQYVSACLTCLAANVTVQREMEPQEAETLAVRWSSLLCGQENQPGLNLYARQSQTLAWAARHVETGDGMLLGRLHSMPEPCHTTRFRDEAKSFDLALERIQHIFLGLRRGEIAFVPAMAQVAQTFNGDETRLLRWKELAEDLPKFLGWLPVFERAAAYLSASFPSADTELEALKKALLAACNEPHRFLEARAREQFDGNFARFRAGYIEFYCSAHDETVHIVADQEKMRSRVDSVALRNLELLSELSPVDKPFLNQVRAIGKFLQASQCDLPVRHILDRQPRCYCNFNPAGDRLLAKSIDRMSQAIEEGINHLRAKLRKHHVVIIQELAGMNLEDNHAKQIAALLSRGPMIPLKPAAIEVLNAILRKHSTAFSPEPQLPVMDRAPKAEEMSDDFVVAE